MNSPLSLIDNTEKYFSGTSLSIGDLKWDPHENFLRSKTFKMSSNNIASQLTFEQSVVKRHPDKKTDKDAPSDAQRRSKDVPKTP